MFRRMSVSNNIMAILETRPGSTRRSARARLNELLEELHIGHVRRQPGHEPVGRRAAPRGNRPRPGRGPPLHPAG